MLLSTAHFPPVQYLCKIIDLDSLYLEAQENYQKQSYRNRFRIYGANGPITLSIPIHKSRPLGTPIKEVTIDSSHRWKSVHHRAIQSCYRHSPFYEFYYDDFKAYWEKDWKYLYDLNLHILRTVLHVLELDIEIFETKEFTELVGNMKHDFRGRIHPKKSWNMDPEFKAMEYTQNFSDRYGFQANLSILDLIFQTGPDAVNVLRGSKKSPSPANL